MRRFAPYQLRHARALELAREGIALKRQLGHANLGTTSIYLQGLDPGDHRGEKWRRQVRRAAFLTVALVAALIFGIVVLASGDWIPGTVIVVASLVGLVRELPVIRKLCSAPAPGSRST